MSLLDRKLARDLSTMRGQVITIALLVAAGVAVFVGAISTYDSLLSAREDYYQQARFGDVFAAVKRAPLAVVAHLEEIDGVAAVEPRIVRDVIIDWPVSDLPVSARMVSVANGGDERLERLHLRRGTGPRPGAAREAAINEAFAEANGLQPGGDLRVILNGRVETFQVTGIALSAEYVNAIKPGMFIPDDRSFAILWVDRSAAEAAFDMKGAFNNAVIATAPGADIAQVIADLDRVLSPYGAAGAIARRDQPSNRFVDDELRQLRVTARTIPFIFFGIAAFVLNVAIGRLVAAQREQIAALKALGFANLPIAGHFLKLVAVIVALGSLIGIAGGVLIGHGMMVTYRDFFRFPVLDLHLTAWSAVAATFLSLAAAALGVFAALRGVVELAPAVAMRPQAPRGFCHSPLEKLMAWLKVGPRRIMVLRNMAGRPFRVLFTMAGVAFAVPMVVLGLFWRDAIDHMIDVQFTLIERGNVMVTFPQPLDRSVLGDLARQSGVMAVEGERYVAARLKAGHLTHLTAVIGLPQDGDLRQPRDKSLKAIAIAAEGLTLARVLAERLGVGKGDMVTVDVLEGRRRSRDVELAAIVEDILGMSAYMDLAALNRMTGEDGVVSAAELYVEPQSVGALGRRFKELPIIETVTLKTRAITSFIDKVAGMVLVMAAILTGFAVIIAVGVVYNNARIGLQERAWELASLRVLGFTRAEVSAILFAEFAIEVGFGVPVGLWLSQVIVDLLARYSSNESFQIPPVIEPRTFVAAGLVVIAAAVASAWVVRRRIDRLDLVALLKTRE